MSGRFRRGMTAINARTDRPIILRFSILSKARR
jgi:hypothetical protein